MNSSNHNQSRRPSSFNRHSNNHQRWPNRYPKDYREYDNFRGECSVASSSSKDTSYLHGYPKNSQLSPSLRNNHHYNGNNEASGHQHHDRRHGPIGNRPNFQNNNGESRRHHRNSPPINICEPQPQNSLINGPPQEDVRINPVQQFAHNTPQYYIQSSSDESIKSESPSRKRRRLSSRSGRHIDLNAQSSSPPRRSPRQCPPPPSTSHSHYSMPDRPSMRNPRYRERIDFPHSQHQTFLIPPSSPPVAHVHPHQSPMMMDINQVPMPFSIGHDPVWSLTSSHQFSLCTAPPGAPPHMHRCHLHNMHNVYAAAAAPQLLSQQFPPCLPHQGFGAFAAAPPPPPQISHHHQHYPHHQHLSAQRADSIDLDLLDHNVHHHGHHTHTASLHHGAPAAIPMPPALQMLNETRNRHMEYLASRQLRNSRIAAQARPRWPPSPPLLTAPAGILLHFLAMFSNPPQSLFNQSELTSGDSTSEPENYEALLNLADQLGDAKPRGLSKMEIESLVCYKFNADKSQADQTSCVVCMCDFETRQTIRVLPCAHEFHAKCIDKWLRSNRTCPICRGNASEYFNNND